jgi:hypothetical protein
LARPWSAPGGDFAGQCRTLKASKAYGGDEDGHRKKVTEMIGDLQHDAMLTAIELMRQLAVAYAYPGNDPDRVAADQASTVDRYLMKQASSNPEEVLIAVPFLACCLTQRAVTYMMMALEIHLERRPTEAEMIAELDKGEWGALGRQDCAALTAVELTRQMVVASKHFGNDPERGIKAQVDAINGYVATHGIPGVAETAAAVHSLVRMLAHGATHSLIAALENDLGHPPTEAEMMAELDDDERQQLSFREDKD